MRTVTTKVAENTIDGKLVKLTGDKLTYTSGEGDEHHFTVGKEAKVTCDGKDAKLSDLKVGSTIRITTCKDDKHKILAVDGGKHIPSLPHA